MASGDGDEGQASVSAAAPPAKGPLSLISEPPLPIPRGNVLFGGVPGLALFTAVVAMGHIQLRRVILPFLVGQGALVPEWIMQTEPLLLATAFFGALVTHAWCIAEFATEKRFAQPARRGVIVLLSAGLWMTVLISGLLPIARANMRIQLVIMAAGATHMLAWQLAMGAARYDRSLAGRTTAALIAAAGIFPLGSLALRYSPLLAHTQLAHEGVAGLHGLGELAYLLVPIAAAFAVVPWDEDRGAVLSRRVGAIVVFLCGVVFAAASRMPEGTYGDYLYATLRLEWALERASLGYTVPVSLAMGAAAAASVSRDPRHRQGGAGLFLWLAGGYNPLSPGRLLIISTGVALICRAVISLARDASTSWPNERDADA